LKIDFIYDEFCPNFEAARAVLKRALGELGLRMTWQEWNRSEQSVPAFVSQFGSPTILVNGRDVAGMEPESEISCCRLYEDTAGHLKKVPPFEVVVRAILKGE
jgi:mercuric ion transport protein